MGNGPYPGVETPGQIQRDASKTLTIGKLGVLLGKASGQTKKLT
jgi:hypothetical protein